MRFIFYLFSFIFLFYSYSFAGYFKLGSSFASEGENTGNITNIDFSLFSVSNYSVGLGFEQGLYSSAGYYNKIEQLKPLINSSNFNNMHQNIKNIKGFASVTNTFVHVNYDFGKPRGFYVTGGIGYGIRVKPKDTLVSAAYLASIVSENQDLQSLMEDVEFQNAIQDLASNPSELINLINTLVPDASDLVAMVDTVEEISNLMNDSQALDNFLSAAENRFDNTSIGNLNSINSICSAILDCKYGVAYQLGIGYDQPIWGILGLDFNTKVRLMAGMDPVYSAGINLILRY